MLQKLLNKYKFKNNGILPMYGPGGFVAKPTASDSLAVMNSQIALNKFYDNEVKNGRLIKDTYDAITDKDSLKKKLKELNDENLNFYRRQITDREKIGRGGSDREYEGIFNLNPSNVSKLEYQGLGKTKSGDANKQYYRDLITPMQNLASPFALVDGRIEPRAEIGYIPTMRGRYAYPGGAVMVYDYDPIAVKPAAMKTAADWAYMKKTYGTKPPTQQTGTTTRPPAQQTGTANRRVTTTATTKPPARQTINTTQGQVTGVVKPNKIKGSQLTMMINPVRSKENLERMEMTPYTFNNPIGVPHGELLPITPMKLKQQGTNPYYGPGHTIIGYTDGNMHFYPAQQYTGAPNNQLNLQDKELLNNPEMLQKYVQSRDNYKFAEGGGIPERYKNMGFTNVGAKKDSTRPDKKWMVLAKKGEDYKVVHGGYQGMQDFKQHHSEQRRENFWNRMGGKDSAKANDPFSPLYWHKRFGTWKYGGQLPKFVLGGKDDGNDDGNGGVSDHYVNLGPLDYSRPKEEQQSLYGQLAMPVKIGPTEYSGPLDYSRPKEEQQSLYGQLAMPQFKMEEEVKKPNVKTKTVREPFNQKYMRASNALFTGLDMLGKRNKNSYSNAIKDFNKNQLDYENNNVDLYSTKQDYYGMFSEGGTSTEPKRKLKKFYETMSEDPTYYSDELEVLKDDYNKILQEEEAERNQSLEDYINGRVNSIEPEKVIVQDDVTYVPYRAPERIPLFYDQTNGQKPYQPTYAPELNIGFSALNRFNTAKQMEGWNYGFGSQGQNNEIDCSSFACKVVGVPRMISEDLVVRGKNFRPYQGVEDLKEGTVIGYDFGPRFDKKTGKQWDAGRKNGIDHVGVIVMNPKTKQLEYRESAGGVGVRTLTIPQFIERYPKRAKKTFVSDYGG